MDNSLKEIISIFSGLIVLAIVATLFSKNANTSGVISSTFSGFSTAVQAAESPVSGNGLGIGSLNSTLNNFNQGF
jgi:PRD1 phage membrane DNA delivery